MYSVTGITAYRHMTAPASKTKRVWRVSGTGKNGTDTQLPSAIRAINDADNAIILDRFRSPNIVNLKKFSG
jgi:hypothetical protein